jgi:two-component system OmpR family sensor kinase
MMRLRGLRARLTLLVAGVVVLAVILAFATVYRGTSSQLGSRTDDDLRSDMASLQAALGDGTSVDAVLTRARSYVGATPFSATARVVFLSAPGREPVTNQPELLEHGTHDDRGDGGRGNGDAVAQLQAGPVGLSSQDIPGAGGVRVLAADQRVGSTTVRLVVGESLAANDRATRVVLDGFVGAGLLALVAALVAGFLVAGRIARPLQRMAGVAARVDEGDLGGRMGATGRNDEVGALAHSFDLMLERLQEAFARQRAFVADASHELRTPLTVIRGQLELLAMQRAPDAADVREVERVTRIEIERMSRLVDDLLVLAHAGEESFLRPQPIDLPGFLSDVFDPLRQTEPRRYVLGAIPHVVLEADPDRLAQALRNLLRNAVAHTREGGLVRLAATQKGERVLLTVDDDGPGVPPGERAHIFDRFHRLGTERGAGAGAGAGAGLGLSIARAIVEAHGGEIVVDASPEDGARFTVSLPLPSLDTLSSTPHEPLTRVVDSDC